MDVRIQSTESAGIRQTSRWALIAATTVLLMISGHAPTAAAQLQGPVQDIGVRPELLKDVGIDQKLNDSIPLGITFKDEHGTPVVLGQYFGQ